MSCRDDLHRHLRLSGVPLGMARLLARQRRARVLLQDEDEDFDLVNCFAADPSEGGRYDS